MTSRTLRRSVVAVAGGTLVVVGVALLVLPGPGILVVLAGVSVLATEFDWAHRLQQRVRDAVERRRSTSRRRTDSAAAATTRRRAPVVCETTAQDRAA